MSNRCTFRMELRVEATPWREKGKAYAEAIATYLRSCKSRG